MKNSFKWILYILLSLGGLFVIGTIVINYLITDKIEHFIKEDLPKNISGSYNDLSVGIFNGTILLKDPKITVGTHTDSLNHTFINGKKLKISGLSYWRYFFQNEIHIGKIIIENPEMTYFKDRKNSEDTIQKKSNKLPNPIFVDLFQVDNSQLTIFENAKDSTKLFTKNVYLKLRDIEINENTLKQKIPLKYNSFEAKGDSTFLKANDYENLFIGDFAIENHNLLLNKLEFRTKYSKTELSQIIKVERDHYTLSLNSLWINQFDFGYIENEFYAKSKYITLNEPSLNIYRDKLVADDNSIKPLYSQSLRELPFQLTIDSISVVNGDLEYEEKVKQENPAGAINFKNLNATFLNVSNTYQTPPKTELRIKALFMGQTPYSSIWSFDVQNTDDTFLYEGKMGMLEAEKMNQFTEPNLKVRLEGQANETYFTIDGNNNTSSTDMKINYSDFKVSVLQKDSEKKNRLVSAIVNIFIAKDSDKKDGKYSEATAEATRDKTKSIFNFLWISVKNALEKCLTGSGESEKKNK